METLVAMAVAISPIALFAGAFGLVVMRARRLRLGGGSVVGPFQEMWDPGARRTQIEVEVRAAEAAPAPSPDDSLIPHRV
ncbi:hypothetical protein AB0L82_34070 [Nocardia sp. NPDC052001]|uniref:hypothetical protein n=1 Tax=Nocardia sp. NPDC052001 TaxID=3154853 RepID=UPI0034133FB5